MGFGYCYTFTPTIHAVGNSSHPSILNCIGSLVLKIRLRLHNHTPELLGFAVDKAVENWLERLGSYESDLKNLPKVG